MPPDPTPWYEAWLVPTGVGTVGILAGALIEPLRAWVQRLPGRLAGGSRRLTATVGRGLWLAGSEKEWTLRECADAVAVSLEGNGILNLQGEATLSANFRLVNRSPHPLKLTLHEVSGETTFGGQFACPKTDTLDLPSQMLAGGAPGSVGVQLRMFSSIDPVGVRRINSSLSNPDPNQHSIPYPCVLKLDAYVNGPTGGEKFIFSVPTVLILQR